MGTLRCANENGGEEASDICTKQLKDTIFSFFFSELSNL